MSVTTHCAICGKELNIAVGRLKERNYCAPCYRATLKGVSHPGWKGGKVTYTCERCGKPKQIDRSRVKSGGGRFCSYKCLYAWLGEKHRGSGSPLWKGGPETIMCENCGVEFEVPRRIINGRGARFCSTGCWGEWKSRNLRGEDAQTWQGGIAHAPYPDDWNGSLRDTMRTRDRHRCVICKEMARQGRRDLSVHHINYDKKNSAWANLVTLCGSHHAATNHNREWWSYYLPRYSRGRHVIQK